jgi:hypothetical protein
VPSSPLSYSMKESKMPARKDLSNKVFGSLTAIWPAGINGQKIMWLCACNCGDLKLVPCRSLLNGEARGRSCKKCHPRIDGTPIHTLWACAKQRARDGGRSFDLALSDIVIPKICPKLGIPIFSSKGRSGPNSPSIDRKDSSQGYTKDNIQIISWRANRLKCDGTKEEFESLLRNWDK